MFSYGGSRRQGDHGLLCNDRYCLCSREQFYQSPIVLAIFIFVFFLFYRLGFKYGFTKVGYGFFNLKKLNDNDQSNNS